MKQNIVKLAERRRLPDALIRMGIRSLLKNRLKSEKNNPNEEQSFINELDASPIAIQTEKANEQHYELPSEYFKSVLGPRLKYSCGHWDNDHDTLKSSEEAMLKLTCERAEIDNGQAILELGCGWGSLSLWMAEMYPQSEITAVSNSRTQKEFIEARAIELGLGNIRVITCDMNSFNPAGSYDRVVSIEMFEHMKNYRLLIKSISKWLKPHGKLFVHIFSHMKYAYHFENSSNADDWMANYFFSGGTMPSDSLLLNFQDDLKVEDHWQVNGIHYSKTLEAWLSIQDEKEKEILPVFTKTYGSIELAKLWIQRWRMFYMACSELFKFNGGNEWIVSHYRFTRKPVV